MLLNKLRASRGWTARLLAIVFGVAMAAGHAPLDFPWLVFLAVPALFMLSAGHSVAASFGIGWFAGLGYFAAALHWIVEPFLVDAAVTGWMAPFALFFLAAGLALFWGAAFAIWRAIPLDGFPAVLSLAVVWTLVEMLRSYALTGFPWAHIGYLWMETPLAQSLAYLGPNGLAFVTLVVVLLPVAVIGRFGAGVAIMLFALGTSWFGWSQRAPDVALVSDVNVRLVQPNVPQHLKWQPEHMQHFFERHLTMTSAEGNVDLVIWP